MPTPATAIDHHLTRLDNGLSLIVHTDRSDPLVCVFVAYHVGSAREVLGRTGFAHLFEHMLFQGSAHVAEGGHFRHIQSAGGTLNGTTSLDRTVYFETLPKSHLDLALWLESDRMGFLLEAMTQKKLDNQRDVVCNERRQNYDNRPYGRVAETVAAHLFPAGHPYQWLPIGSLEDVQAATLDDVADFFRRWYGPNNATLCIAGDVGVDEAIAAARRWFGGIPRGPAVERQAPRAARLEREVRASIADQVALPQISMTWAGAEQFSADAPALGLLAMVLSQNKSSVLDRALMVETTLARAVGAGHWDAELAGRFDITVRASPGVELAVLEARVRELLHGLHRQGIDPKALERMKTRCEADVVRSLETLVGRASSLAEHHVFTGDPGRQAVELERLRAVTTEQVREVLDRYLLRQPAVVLACIPGGAPVVAAAPAAATSQPRPKPPSNEGVRASARPDASVDRSTPPAPTSVVKPTLPQAWLHAIDGGSTIGAARFTRAPWTTLMLSLPMGRRAERGANAGLASLTAAAWMEGTRRASTTEFTDDLEAIGAQLSIAAGDDEVHLGLSVLDRALEPALELVIEAALEPRFDPADFERVRAQRRASLTARAENPGSVAARAWARRIHGATPLGRSPLGDEAGLEATTREGIVEFHARGTHRRGARLTAAGPRERGDLEPRLARVLERLPRAPADAWTLHSLASDPVAAGRRGARVFVVDRPGAQQSELRVGHLSVASGDDDYFPLNVLNYVLGGSFNSRINMNLRESKGYTYGARSSFAGGVLPGAFTVAAAVETSVSAAAVAEILHELREIRSGPRQEELDFAKAAMRQSLASQYESCDARRALVDSAAKFAWPLDYPLRRVERLEALSCDELARLAQAHLDPARWIVLAVGDAAAIEAGLADLGLGDVARLDVDGLELDPR